jgi:hypothetical protein
MALSMSLSTDWSMPTPSSSSPPMTRRPVLAPRMPADTEPRSVSVGLFPLARASGPQVVQRDPTGDDGMCEVVHQRIGGVGVGT